MLKRQLDDKTKKIDDFRAKYSIQAQQQQVWSILASPLRDHMCGLHDRHAVFLLYSGIKAVVFFCFFLMLSLILVCIAVLFLRVVGVLKMTVGMLKQAAFLLNEAGFETLSY